MAQQNIATTHPLTWEKIQTEFDKINSNFDDLYAGVTPELGSVNQHIIPDSDETYDLGSPTKKWRTLYVSSSTVYFGNVPLTVSGDGTLSLNGEVAATPGGATTWDSITSKPTFATVATSGSYSDLADQPTIPTLTSQLTNDSGFLTSVGTISYNDLSNQPTIPTLTSQLTNDSGFLTSVGTISYNSLSDKPSIPSITGLATEQYVNDAVGAIVIPDVSNFITADDIPFIPTDINQLSDSEGLLSGSGGTTLTRSNITFSSIYNTGQTQTSNQVGPKSYLLYKIFTSKAAWVRIYSDSASMIADSSRLEGDDPAPGSGVIAEVITLGAETVLMTPGVVGFNSDSPIDSRIYMSVTNKSGSNNIVVVDLEILGLED